ncbi:hypothetical protein FACS1894199_17830 [Bacteroidia bacterium]|nr:hypothetical protein FACS1894199_17830 [Bacteroidia bacterium]
MVGVAALTSGALYSTNGCLNKDHGVTLAYSDAVPAGIINVRVFKAGEGILPKRLVPKVTDAGLAQATFTVSRLLQLSKAKP